MPGAGEETQMLANTAQGRCIFAFNVRDFVVLARSYPWNDGIILAAQASWTLSELIVALDRPLSEAEAEEWSGQVCWLNDWQRRSQFISPISTPARKARQGWQARELALFLFDRCTIRRN